MFTVAVAGPPLPETTCDALVSDALADTLSPDKHPLRVLVPTAADSLTEGVRAVVEWAWQQPSSHTVAVYDGHLLFNDIERSFVEQGSDELLEVADVPLAIVKELADAKPNSALLVVLHEAELDPLTLRLASLCFDAEVPIFDVSHGAIPLCRNDVTGWEPEAETSAPVDADVSEVVVEAQPAPKMAVATPVDVTEDIPDEHEILRELRRQFTRIEKTAAEAISSLDDAMEGKPRARTARDYPILISYAGDPTRHPRGRGKAPRGSTEYNGRTGEVLREH